MTIQFIEESTLTAMADAIRIGTGKEDTMKPSAMAKEIAKIKDYSKSREGKYVWSVQSGDGTTVDANTETKYVASNDTALYPLDGWIDNNYFKLVKKPETIVNGVKIVEWNKGTDEEICNMVAAADEGKINLADYWAVGDIRTVQLSAIAATYVNPLNPGVRESHDAQPVELVLMHTGGYDLNAAVASGRTKCSFVVGMKDALVNNGYMNHNNKNEGSWDMCNRRTWCNSAFKNAIPSTLLPIFKQFKTITADTLHTQAELKTSVDWFALPAAKEIFGGSATSSGVDTSFSDLIEFNALFQFDWYKTAVNRVKKHGMTGSKTMSWDRSPYYKGSSAFCIVNPDGSAEVADAYSDRAISPFGCI